MLTADDLHVDIVEVLLSLRQILAFQAPYLVHDEPLVQALTEILSRRVLEGLLKSLDKESVVFSNTF